MLDAIQPIRARDSAIAPVTYFRIGQIADTDSTARCVACNSRDVPEAEELIVRAGANIRRAAPYRIMLSTTWFALITAIC